MNTPKLSITKGEGAPDGPQILHLAGPLVMATTADFQRELRAELAQIVVLDFREVPFIDSSGLGSMISIYLHFKRGQRKLVVAGMNEKCSALLRMSNVESLFPTYDTIETARKALI
jgi:anti-sigma B factor antagonist